MDTQCSKRVPREIRRTMYQVRCAPQRGTSKHKQTIIKWYEDYGKYMMDIVYPKTSLKGPFNFLTNIGLATGINTMSRNVFQSIDFTLYTQKTNETEDPAITPYHDLPSRNFQLFSRGPVDKELNLQCQVLLILQKQPCLHGAGLPESGW